MKAISTPLLVAVVAIVLLITAIVLLTIFSGGIQNIGQVVNQWISGVPSTPKQCELYTGAEFSKCTMLAGCKPCDGGACVSIGGKCPGKETTPEELEKIKKGFESP